MNFSHLFGLSISFGVSIAGACAPEPGCGADDDCRGNRICVEGECADDDDDSAEGDPPSDPDVVFAGGQVCGSVRHFDFNDNLTLTVSTTVRNDGGSGTFVYRWDPPGECGPFESQVFAVEPQAELGVGASFVCPMSQDGLLPLGLSDLSIFSSSTTTGPSTVKSDNMTINFGGSVPQDGSQECIPAPSN